MSPGKNVQPITQLWSSWGSWTVFAVLLVADVVVSDQTSLAPLYGAPVAMAVLGTGKWRGMVMATLATLVAPVAGGYFAWSPAFHVQWAPILVAACSYYALVFVVLRSRTARRRPSAERDALTDLANAAGLRRWFTRWDSNASVSAIAFDIDAFEYICDRWGHDIGDRVLQDVAERLRRCVRPGDLVARVGRERFIVAIAGRAGEPVAQRIRAAACAVPIHVGLTGIKVTATMGIAEGQANDDLIDRAQEAATRRRSLVPLGAAADTSG